MIDGTANALLSSHRWLARLINGKSNYMVIVKACFDESGKLADQNYVVFAGCVATDNSWGALSEQWRSILKENHIRYLTMKEAIGLYGEFRGYKNNIPERDALLLKLATISHQLIHTYYSAIICIKEHWLTIPPKQRAKFKNPQYCGFEACVKGVLKAVKATAGIQIYCDSAEEYSDQILSLYHKLKLRNEEFRRRCIAITFADDEHFEPLQMADMVAYCSRHTHDKSSTPQPVILELQKIFDQEGVTESGLIYQQGDELGAGVTEPFEIKPRRKR